VVRCGLDSLGSGKGPLASCYEQNIVPSDPQRQEISSLAE